MTQAVAEGLTLLQDIDAKIADGEQLLAKAHADAERAQELLADLRAIRAKTGDLVLRAQLAAAGLL